VFVIEGDEFYTKINENTSAAGSSGWTIVLMDRASRFMWELSCGKKDKALFETAIKRLADLIERTESITLVTDRERRYGKILFEICHELLRTGKVGRPRKTLKKGLLSRLKLNNHRLKVGGFKASAESTDTGHKDPFMVPF